jgi:hypothetical protein
MYRQYGLRYAFTFINEKIKKKWSNRNIGATFYQSTLLSAQQITDSKKTIEEY